MIDALFDVVPKAALILVPLFALFVRCMHSAENESGPVRVAPENRVAPCPPHVIPARPVEGRRRLWAVPDNAAHGHAAVPARPELYDQELELDEVRP